jgi:hypothetical protein
MTRALALAAAAALALLAAAPSSAADEELAAIEREVAQQPKRCHVPAPLIADPSLLRRTAGRLRAERTLRIVVLGTATAAGAGASSPAKAWPARLEEELRLRYPQASLQVTVMARASETAQKMLARMDAVAAVRPHLVIWETGTPEAVRGLNVEEFVAAMRDGIDRLAETRTDILLVEPQYARKTAMMINFTPYLEAIAQAAAMRDLIVFPRYAVMRWWSEHEQIVVDGLPLNMMAETADKVYDCVARLIAIQVQHGLRTP